MPSLFDPIRLGAIAAPNRIIMAPLTRGRATREHVPTPLMAEYYAQRAGAGLIISEATGISQQGLGRVDGFNQDHGASKGDDCVVALVGLFAS